MKRFLGKEELSALSDPNAADEVSKLAASTNLASDMGF